VDSTPQTIDFLLTAKRRRIRPEKQIAQFRCILRVFEGDGKPKMEIPVKATRPKQYGRALVIRTEFENQQAWETICELIRAPVLEYGDTFYANVEFLEDDEFRDLSKEDLLPRVPAGYLHSFVFVVDREAVSNPEFPILVVDLLRERGRVFRAIPSTIQSIDNNLSIANMGFFEFANAVDADDVFRGFAKP
jgi:hypothetical protein